MGIVAMWGLALFAWVFASAGVCAYWAMMRSGDKRRAAELKEKAKMLAEDVTRLQTRLQTEVLTPAEKDYLRMLYVRAIEDARYWAERAHAWDIGEY